MRALLIVIALFGLAGCKSSLPEYMREVNPVRQLKAPADRALIVFVRPSGDHDELPAHVIDDHEMRITHVLRGDEWIFGPEASYERVGDVGNVAFPCGSTLGADGDSINVYYGAANTCIALATGSVKDMLSWLDAHGE